MRLAPLLAGALLFTACSRGHLAPGGAGGALTPSASTRGRLIGQLVVPALSRTLATADALRARGALPFGGDELRTMLAARLGLPAEVLDVVDLQRPIALALVSSGGGTTRLAGACELRPAQAAAAVLGVLGPPIASERGAQQFRRPDGKALWIVREGTTFFWADDLEALTEAGAHAGQARQPVSDDLLLRVFPPGLAHWHGVTLAGDGRALREALLARRERQAQAGGRALPAAERATLEAVLDFLVRPLPDTNLFDLGVRLGEARGAQLRLEAQPRPGTTFARQLAQPAPLQLDAGLIAGRGLAWVAGAGASPRPTWLELVRGIVDAQARAGLDGAPAVATRLGALATHLSGAVTSTARTSGGPALRQDAVLGLRPGTDPAVALEALAALASEPGLGALLRQAYGSQAPAVTVQRGGGPSAPLRIELAFPAATRRGGLAALAEGFFGTRRPVLLASAAADRLRLAWEPEAQPRLAPSLAAGGAGRPEEPALVTALGETAGREGLLYLDVWAVGRPAVEASLSGPEARLLGGLLALPGLAQLDLPAWLSHRGGQRLEVELRLPLRTLTNATAALGLFGQGGGLGLAPP